MKIFTINNQHAIERLTLENQKIGIEEMVERMAEGSVAEIVSRWRPSRPTVVFAGPGENGALALAVARLMIHQGFRCRIYLFNIVRMEMGQLTRRFRDILKSDIPDAELTEVTREFSLPELTPEYLVIDGLFGSDLRAPLVSGFQSLVRYINESEPTVVSLDIPSGMFPDWNPQTIARNIIHATLTLCAQFPHPAFFFDENADLVGEWKAIDVGMSAEAIHSTPTPYHYLEFDEVKRLLRKRPAVSTKADYGSALIIAGSRGMMGAATFAAEGALRAGAGKVTAMVPQCGLDVMQTRVPEAMCMVDSSAACITDMTPERPFTAYGVGPGIGTSSATAAALEKFLKCADRPVVIDADALNCISKNPQILNFVPKFSVLTPHAGEFDRLFGEHPNMESRLHKAVEMSRHYNVLIVLKAHHTALVRPDGKVYFNSTGTPALATPGSGDVLTGVITGLMAQGYKPEVASLLGVYVHGLAGDIAARTEGQYGVLASEVASCVGRAIKEIMQL